MSDDTLHPAFKATLDRFCADSAQQPYLRPIPYEQVGKPGRRASERDRDNAAIELAAFVVAILKFTPSDLSAHRDELLKRANKVRRAQGNGNVVFVHETAERIRAVAEAATAPSPSMADFHRLEDLLGSPS